MRKEEFIRSYSTLYHMCECDSWPSVQRHGLLSVTALLDFCGYDGITREPFEAQWRPAKMNIYHSKYGAIVLRDQKPIPPDALGRCLTQGMNTSDWYKLLNGKIFFWVKFERLKRMLTANAYINQPQWVITVSTEALLDRYADMVTLSPFNTGFAHDNRSRGIGTFKTLEEWPQTREAVELAVDYGVPDIAKFAIDVTEWKGIWEKGEKKCEPLRKIWPR